MKFKELMAVYDYGTPICVFIDGETYYDESKSHKEFPGEPLYHLRDDIFDDDTGNLKKKLQELYWYEPIKDYEVQYFGPDKMNNEYVEAISLYSRTTEKKLKNKTFNEIRYQKDDSREEKLNYRIKFALNTANTLAIVRLEDLGEEIKEENTLEDKLSNIIEYLQVTIIDKLSLYYPDDFSWNDHGLYLDSDLKICLSRLKGKPYTERNSTVDLLEHWMKLLMRVKAWKKVDTWTTYRCFDALKEYMPDPSDNIDEYYK